MRDARNDDLLAGLNPVQREAVTHPGGPLLVVAGAGSGKTRVLTHRVAWLIRQGVSPFSILAITFTNKAAEEMKARVAALVGPVAERMWVSTFHAACVRILRREAHRLGYGSQFTILDEDDQRLAIRECLRELQLDEDKVKPGSVAARISRWKNGLQNPEDDQHAALVLPIYRRYQEKLRQANAMDFDDLLVNTVMLLEEHPEPAAFWPEHFLHVLVDEYQDTNYAQYRLLRRLTSRHGNLFAVGDEDQSIYAFRGADPHNIVRLEKDHPQLHVVRLERNYRSTQNILDAASGVIARNRRRFPKRLWTDRGTGAPVVLYRARDEQDEATFVADEIAAQAARGRSWSEFAVLYRTHAQSRALEEALLARGIPYTVVGGLKFYERQEIKDALAWLRLVVNPDDWLAFVRAVMAPKRGIGETSLERLAAHMRETGQRLSQALAAAEGIIPRTGHLLSAFGQLLDQLRQEVELLDLASAVRHVIQRSGLRDQLVEEDTLEARSRLENLNELVSVAKEASQLFEPGLAGLGAFLAQVALIAEADSFQEGQPAVVLMTLHAAKGLEFPVVFLAGLEEGVFPHGRSMDSEAALEEERRLCYVGMTRAKERLYLSCAEERTLFGFRQRNKASRFLEEIDPDLLEVRESAWAGPRETVWDWGRQRRREPLPQRDEGEGWDGQAFQPGDTVLHPRWGPGTVVAARGQGPDAEVTIAFPDAGTRTVILRYARLQRLG